MPEQSRRPGLPPAGSDRHHLVGWLWVGLQAALLVVLVALRGSDDWPTPRWLGFAGTAAVTVGLLIAAVAATGLGRLLTPTPVPKQSGELVTTGLYRLVRHPIYSGVLLAVVGIVAPSGSWWILIVGLITVGFFHAKSSWEEGHLIERYPGYRQYQRTTPRFVPRLRH